MGVPVSMDRLQPGDLVFFHGLGHMGMYIGGDSFIHAPHSGDVVKIFVVLRGVLLRQLGGSQESPVVAAARRVL